MIFRIFVKTDINSINLVGFKSEMHKKRGRGGMRNEELAKLNRVVLKYEVKDSTECSDFAEVGSCPKYCRGRRPRCPVRKGNAVFLLFVIKFV